MGATGKCYDGANKPGSLLRASVRASTEARVQVKLRFAMRQPCWQRSFSCVRVAVLPLLAHGGQFAP